MAGKEGTYKIPGATIVADGDNYTSNSVEIKVLPPDQTSGANNGNSARSSRDQANSGKISNQELFMMATASKTNVYEQEAILLTYKVYTQVNLTGLRGDVPDLKGFHTQEVELPQQKTFTLEHYNGRNYNTTVWRQFVLFPQQTGKIEIPLYIGIGGAAQNYVDKSYFGLAIKPEVGFFYRFSSEWSFGALAGLYILPQWFRNSDYNYTGFITDISASVRYHF
jgi:hypothetical protein